MLNFISVVSLTSWSNENSYFWELISCRINSNNSLKVYSSECLYSPFDTSKFTSERSMPIDFDKNLSKNLKINSIDIPSISFFKFVFYNFVFDLNSWEFIEFILKEIQFGESWKWSLIKEVIMSIFSRLHFWNGIIGAPS